MTTAWSWFCACFSRIASSNSSRVTRRSAVALARSRSHSEPSTRPETSSGCTGGEDALSICGSSTWPGVMSGAVTMKITSSTSITSMYGTTLIWFMSRRVLRFSMSTRRSSVRLPLEDVGEFLHEGLEARGQPVHVTGEAVVGDDGGNRGEQAHGGRNQRFRNARCDMAQCGLRDVGEPAEGVHDPPHRAEETDVRAHRPD